MKLNWFGIVVLIVTYVPISTFAQLSIKPSYGIFVNNGMTEIWPGNDAGGCSSMRALSYYVSAGLQTKVDTIFTLAASLRYGTERNRIEKEIAPDNYIFYHLHNRTLAMCLSVGLDLDPDQQISRHKLFLGLNIVRIFESHEEGYGQRGNGYQYTLGRNLLRTCWDFRPGINYQFKLHPRKNIWLESGIEPSMVKRMTELQKNTASNFAPTYYHISYSLVMLYVGLAF